MEIKYVLDYCESPTVKGHEKANFVKIVHKDSEEVFFEGHYLDIPYKLLDWEIFTFMIGYGGRRNSVDVLIVR